MCTYSICFIALLVAVVLVQPVEGKTNEDRSALEEPLCRFVRSAAGQAQLEAGLITRPPEEENPGAADPDPRTPSYAEEPSRTNHSNLPADRESSPADWSSFANLAHKQQAIIRDLLTRCGCKRDSVSITASVFSQFNVSQRATFVGVTNALTHTHILDRENGEDLGDAFQMIDGLVDLRGENIALPSDHQFQLIVRLAPGALQKLDHASGFERGVNHVFHKGYPISFRQFRRFGVRGQEAGLHISVVPDGHLAEIHIDYRFWLLHLGPANADVRDPGNHKKHTDRWPNSGFAVQIARARASRIALTYLAWNQGPTSGQSYAPDGFTLRNRTFPRTSTLASRRA